MNKFFKLITLLATTGAFLSFSHNAAAADVGSADEAVALVKKAAAFVNANGNDKAFAAFNDPKGAFIDRDLYIFAIDMNGKVLAHGTNAKLIGKDMTEIKDVDGKYFTKAFIETAKTKGSGWVDYKWTNPITKGIDRKSTYVMKVGDMLLACGIYVK